MTQPHDPTGLWMKAKAQINRSFAAVDDGDFPHAALWAAASLELLGKAALAKVNPLLIADPQDDGRSLLVAAGLSNDVARFKSVPAKAVFSRCARAFPPFSAKEAGLIATERNAELHSASTPFNGIDEAAWWERYWAQAVLLVQAQDFDLDDFVGSAREAVVEAHLARNAANVAARVEGLIARAIQRFAAASSSADARAEIEAIAARVVFAIDHSGSAVCPACGESGTLSGDYVLSSDVFPPEEDEGGWGRAVEILTVHADIFECDHCGLRLVGPDYLDLTDLPATFEVETEYEPDWDSYGND